MPVGPIDRLSVQLWLPEGFKSMLVDLIAPEENEIHRGALGRCLSGLRSQTISSHALASQEVLSEATYSMVRLSAVWFTHARINENVNQCVGDKGGYNVAMSVCSICSSLLKFAQFSSSLLKFAQVAPSPLDQVC